MKSLRHRMTHARPRALAQMLCALMVSSAIGHGAAAADWRPATETVVLYNKNYPDSEKLARYYAAKRNIPEKHLFALDTSNDETITREEYDQHIRGPLREHLFSDGSMVVGMRDVMDPVTKKIVSMRALVHQEVRAFAVMRGVPLKIKRSNDRKDLHPTKGDEASVDSELTLIASEKVNIPGAVVNPFYQSTQRFHENPKNLGGIMVGRLDAPDEATVRRMIDDTLHAEREGLWGRAVIDYCKIAGAYEEGDKWLAETSKLYRENGIPVLADTYQGVLREHWPLPDTILYFGWYEGAIKGALASPEFRFKAGAIACHLHSFSADTLRSKTANWCAPLLDQGAAAVLGNVWEPFLPLTTHFDIFNDRLLKGFTVAEAMLAATPGLSWMNVLVGDPIYVPFPQQRVTKNAKPEDKDYIDYRELVLTTSPDREKKLLPDLVKRGVQERNGRLIEFAGLLNELDGHKGAAEEYYQHAKSIYTDPRDKLRCSLYGVELLFRQGGGNLLQSRLSELRADPAFRDQPALEALSALSPSSK